MLKKGFTLVELLAVIVILMTILAITILSVSNIIADVKESAYDSQVKFILDAAKKYVSFNDYYPDLDTEKIISLKELQDNNYINNNIMDSRTGKEISPTTWIIVTNTNNQYTYTYGYITGGLILQYDGKNSAGLNIRADNTSTNKGTWKDLSGNNNDGVLSNFGYTVSSGWLSNGLAFDGTDDIIDINALVVDGYTVEIIAKVKKNSYNGLITSKSNMSNTLALGPQFSNALFYFGSGSGSNSVVGYGPSLNIVTSIAFTKNNPDKRSVYNNGVKTSINGIYASTFPSSQLVIGNCTWGYLQGDIYSVRIYDHSLEEAEIKYNFAIDKMRFGL